MQFTCPAVFNTVENEYCIVQNGNLLRKWSFDDDNFEKVQKIKFKEKIYSLMELDDKEPIVLFTKGECQFLQHAIQTRKDEKKNYIQDDDIYWVDYISENSEISIVLLTINEKNSTRTLHWIKIPQTKNSIIKQHSVILRKENFLPVTWCLHKNTDKLLFLLLWSDGEIHSYEYGSNHSKKLYSFNFNENNSSFTVCSLDANHIAFLCASNTQEIGDPFLEIWNFKFLVRVEKKVLHVLKEGMQMICLNQHIFIFDGKDLYGMEYNVKPSTLASLLGILSLSKMDGDKIVVTWNNDEMNVSPDVTNMECIETDNCPFITQFESSRKTIPYFCEKILERLQDKPDIKVLANILKYWKHIPERELAKMLRFCLSVSDECFKNYFQSDDAKIDFCPFSPEKATFLNKLLSLPFNDVFLQQYLLSIPFQDIMNFLQYLLYLLKLEKLTGLSSVQPSLQEILPWLCILIDTHFTNFILSKDSQIFQVLSEIADLTNCVIEDYKDMDNLELLLRIVCSQEDDSIEEMNTNCCYCIELVYI